MSSRKGSLFIVNILCTVSLLVGCSVYEVPPTKIPTPTRAPTVNLIGPQTSIPDDSRNLILTSVASTLVAISTQTTEAQIAGSNTLVSPTHLEPTATPISTTTSTEITFPRLPGRELSIIFDDDGSLEGTAALLYLLSLSEISIEAITISYGEAHPQIYIQYIGRMLDYLGFDNIPLGAGQDEPLGKGNAFPDQLRELSDDFWNVPLPNAEKNYPVKDAAELMVETLKNAEEPLTIFISGPFTTLAQALRINPGIRDKIKAVYSMAGAIDVPGNITILVPESDNEVAEWNIYADPQAAKEVFEAGLKIYLVPLDATNQVMVKKEDILTWYEGDEKAQLVAQLFETLFNEYGGEQVGIIDLTAAVLMSRRGFCYFEELYVEVITDDGPTFGQTLPDNTGLPSGVVVLGPESSPQPTSVDTAATKPIINVCRLNHVDPIKQELEYIFTWAGNPSIDSIVGKWAGIAALESIGIQVEIKIDKTCQLGKDCGELVVQNDTCSATLTWIDIIKEYFQFQVEEASKVCLDGYVYLAPIVDGSLIFLNIGSDYGILGILMREP